MNGKMKGLFCLVLLYLLIPVAASAAEQAPVGSSRDAGSLFERTGGYVHPFLSLTEYYTDNVFNTRSNEKEDYVTIISPGIWLAAPRVKERLYDIETSSVTPGGAPLTRFFPRAPGRYQAYVLYRADIERYAKETSENTENHRVDAMLQYNFRGGLSIDLMNQFLKTHNPRGTGDIDTDLDEFDANYFSTVLSYQLSDSLLLRLDYGNYSINYTSEGDDFRDRMDNSASAYAFYKVGPRTALFGQYQFIDINYDKDVLPDNEEHNMFLGIRKEVTAKSLIMLKAGYGIKDFDKSTVDTKNTFLAEAQVRHNFTPKTSAGLIISRRTNESDITADSYVVSDNIGIEYNQRITNKIAGALRVSYTSDKYKGEEITVAGEGTKQRKDKYYSGGPSFIYKFKEWLSAELGYVYTKRDSNFRSFDYTNNTVSFRITGSL
ncbi:MAG: outer membrane beta-barrel protein [Nitrospirota bacterium]